MKNIMLVCNAGMSTSMLVTKMKKAADEKGIDANIWAVSLSEVKENTDNKDIDVILVGPQVKFEVPKLKQSYEPEIKVTDINMQDYGMMNGEKVLNSALNLLED